jgi:hypothetical protein
MSRRQSKWCLFEAWFAVLLLGATMHLAGAPPVIWMIQLGLSCISTFSLAYHLADQTDVDPESEAEIDRG